MSAVGRKTLAAILDPTSAGSTSNILSRLSTLEGYSTTIAKLGTTNVYVKVTDTTGTPSATTKYYTKSGSNYVLAGTEGKITAFTAGTTYYTAEERLTFNGGLIVGTSDGSSSSSGGSGSGSGSGSSLVNADILKDIDTFVDTSVTPNKTYLTYNGTKLAWLSDVPTTDDIPAIDDSQVTILNKFSVSDFKRGTTTLSPSAPKYDDNYLLRFRDFSTLDTPTDANGYDKIQQLLGFGWTLKYYSGEGYKNETYGVEDDDRLYFEGVCGSSRCIAYTEEIDKAVADLEDKIDEVSEAVTNSMSVVVDEDKTTVLSATVTAGDPGIKIGEFSSSDPITNYDLSMYAVINGVTHLHPMANIAESADDDPVYVPGDALFVSKHTTYLSYLYFKIPLNWLYLGADTLPSSPTVVIHIVKRKRNFASAE